MKIAVVGGGFTGLTAALKLSQSHEIVIYEKEKSLGGLADTYKKDHWSFAVEKHYHHWFANDIYAINLIKELGLSDKLIFPTTLTSIFYKNKIYPFNTPSHVLSFTPLPLIDRIRTGIVTLSLKLIPKELALKLETVTASTWLKQYYGQKTFDIIWKPLLEGKFGKYAKEINMAWFWARIKKRTLKLGYLIGGYRALIDTMETKIVQNGGKILLNKSFTEMESDKYDKILVTTPTETFTKMFPTLPAEYIKKLKSIPHLHALNLLLVTKVKFLTDSYWLNINDEKFPFIAVVQQTNMIPASHYGGEHLTYIGNYLPSNHPYLKMTKEELLKTYLPYLKKINPNFNYQLSPASSGTGRAIINSQLFYGPFAQPVFTLNYSRIKPKFNTPISNVYLANMDMVYPWDRGTNYAIELGYQAAEIIEKTQISNLKS